MGTAVHHCYEKTDRPKSKADEVTSKAMLMLVVDGTTSQAMFLLEANGMASHVLFLPEDDRMAAQVLFLPEADGTVPQGMFLPEVDGTAPQAKPGFHPGDHVSVQPSNFSEPVANPSPASCQYAPGLLPSSSRRSPLLKQCLPRDYEFSVDILVRSQRARTTGEGKGFVFGHFGRSALGGTTVSWNSICADYQSIQHA